MEMISIKDWQQSANHDALAKRINMALRFTVAKYQQQTPQQQEQEEQELIKILADSPIALPMERFLNRHFSWPYAMWEKIIGRDLFYSSGLWQRDDETPQQAAQNMMRCICQRAELNNAKSVLDFNGLCGGLSAYIIKHYPHIKLTTVISTPSQQIMLETLKHTMEAPEWTIVLAKDPFQWKDNQQYDRILAIDILDCVRNFKRLLSYFSSSLSARGLLFAQLTTFASGSYLVEDDSTGGGFTHHGTQVSDKFLYHFQEELLVRRHWTMTGLHFMKTLQAWQQCLNDHCKQSPGETEIIERQLYFFFLSQLYGCNQGDCWRISHYLWCKNENK